MLLLLKHVVFICDSSLVAIYTSMYQPVESMAELMDSVRFCTWCGG